MEIQVNQTSIETCIWGIYRCLMRRYGTAVAERDIAPLRWYIISGRASTPFLKLLINAKPFMLARKCHEGGPTETVVKRIKNYVGYSDPI